MMLGENGQIYQGSLDDHNNEYYNNSTNRHLISSSERSLHSLRNGRHESSGNTYLLSVDDRSSTLVNESRSLLGGSGFQSRTTALPVPYSDGPSHAEASNGSFQRSFITNTRLPLQQSQSEGHYSMPFHRNQSAPVLPMPDSTSTLLPSLRRASDQAELTLSGQQTISSDGHPVRRVMSFAEREEALPKNGDVPEVAQSSSYTSTIPTKNANGKYPCPHCSRTYQHAKHLKRHQHRHTGDRPYSCPLCEDTFSRSDILKRHFQKCAIRRGNPENVSHLHLSHANREAVATMTGVALPNEESTDFRTHNNQRRQSNSGRSSMPVSPSHIIPPLSSTFHGMPSLQLMSTMSQVSCYECAHAGIRCDMNKPCGRCRSYHIECSPCETRQTTLSGIAPSHENRITSTSSQPGTFSHDYQYRDGSSAASTHSGLTSPTEVPGESYNFPTTNWPVHSTYSPSPTPVHFSGHTIPQSTYQSFEHNHDMIPTESERRRDNYAPSMHSPPVHSSAHNSINWNIIQPSGTYHQQPYYDPQANRVTEYPANRRDPRDYAGVYKERKNDNMAP